MKNKKKKKLQNLLEQKKEKLMKNLDASKVTGIDQIYLKFLS